MDERQRPSGLTELSSRLDPSSPQKSPTPENPINVPAKLIPVIVIAGLGLAACKPVNASTTTPELFPTSTPAGEVLPSAAPTAITSEAPTKVPEVVIASETVNYAEDQQFIDAQYGDRYILTGMSLTPVGEVSLEGADAEQWAQNALNNARLVKERANITPDTTMLFTNGEEEAASRNAAMSFVGDSIMWPSYSDGQTTFLSVSPSEYWFPVQAEQDKITYTKVALPAGYTSTDVRMGWVGDTQSVELASKDGKGMIVYNPTTQEWREMKNIPSTELLTSVITPFAHAYGDKVSLNGVDVDGTQLLAEIQKNPEAFIQKKTVEGVDYSFIVINGIPLALDAGEGWEQSHMKDLVEIPGGIQYVGAEPRIMGDFFEELNQASTTPGIFWVDNEPQKGQYDFTNFDNYVKTLREKGLVVRGAGLLCSASPMSMPDWLLNGNYTRDELEQILVDHITTVIKHGKALGVTEWIVVNEPYIPKDRENDIFYKTFGGYDYIDIAFAAARKADPDAKLIYNDIDNHTSNGYLTPLTRETINRLKTETVVGDDGVERPVLDAVGIEGHIGDWMPVPNFADVEATLKSYGLPVVVTEFDYTLVGLEGTEEDKLKKQADVYAKFLQAALDAGVTEYTFWSFSDADNHYTDQGITNADPGLFDKQGEPKMAYYAVLQVLLNQVMNGQ